jgi:membrane protein
VRQLFRTLKAAFKDFLQDGGTQLAAALAYFTVFSLPALLILLLWGLGRFMDEQQVQDLLQGELGGILGPAGRQQVASILGSAAERDPSRQDSLLSAVIGLGTLAFGAIGAFVQLQASLNRVWEVAPDPEESGIKTFLAKRLVSFGMLLTIAFLLVVSLVVSAVLAAFGDVLAGFLPGSVSGTALTLINLGISLAVLTLLFALMFKYLPDAEVAWRDVIFGGVATAILFTVGRWGLSLYIARSNPGEAFGAAGSLALLLVWIYYSAIILFLGAEFTQAWADARGRSIVPEKGAVLLEEEVRHVSRSEAKERRWRSPARDRRRQPRAHEGSPE